MSIETKAAAPKVKGLVKTLLDIDGVVGADTLKSLRAVAATPPAK